MAKEIWKIIEVSESVLDPEQGITEQVTLVTICSINGQFEEAETLAVPLEERKFWESHIGDTFEMTEEIHKGFDKDANPILDLEALRKRLYSTFILS